VPRDYRHRDLRHHCREPKGAPVNFISLFSGIGGFDLALENVGMHCLAQVEIDKAARGVLATHYPHVERLNDVTKANKSNLPTVDLICGGFPCQDLSVAGRRAGLDGERSGLWFEFARIIEELKPTWVLIENVPGLLSSNEGRDFKIILDGLVERGYGVCWRVLDAQYFGLAQRRKRLFIVASLGSGRSAQVLFEREGVSGDIDQSRETEDTDAEKTLYRTARCLSTREGRRYNAGDETLLPIAFDYRAGDDSEWHTDDKGSHKGGGAKQIVRAGDYVGALNATKQDAVAFAWHVSASQSMTVHNEISPVLTNSNGMTPATFDVQGVRRLTPTECERLQGFPDTWTAISDGKPQADSARYKQLGNAVAVPVVQWIGKRIMDAHK
jgi:DNA (cytosine-5)-methyltransferase 1